MSVPSSVVSVYTTLFFFQVVPAEKNKDKAGETEQENESIKDKVADEEQEKKEEEQESEEAFRKDKMTEEKVKSPKVPRQPKTIQIKVTLLDNTLYDCELDVRTTTLSSVAITKGFRKADLKQGCRRCPS